MNKFILASQSPRRRELLEALGLKFDIIVSNENEEKVDKNLPCELYTSELALMKACAVAKGIIDRKKQIIISADTVVFYNNEVLTKPCDKEDAKRMLNLLSGNTHQVYTGVCVMRLSDAKTVTKSVVTDVTFKQLDNTTIDNYINTGEPMDKAGAYGIQGKGSVLIDKINGDYFNVVGLPVSALKDILYEEFDIDILNKEFIYES